MTAIHKVTRNHQLPRLERDALLRLLERCAAEASAPTLGRRVYQPRRSIAVERSEQPPYLFPHQLRCERRCRGALHLTISRLS